MKFLLEEKEEKDELNKTTNDLVEKMKIRIIDYES